MNPKLLQWLKQDQEQAPFLYGGPVPESEVVELEHRLGWALPEAYRTFLSLFGGGTVMSETIFGLRTSDTQGVEDLAWTQTLRFREERWPGLEQGLVISNDGSGNPILLQPSGVMMISDLDAGGVNVVAPDFESYLMKWVDVEDGSLLGIV